jgi:hypothetical protein
MTTRIERTVERGAPEQRVTVELVLRELRRHNFAVLSTVGEGGRPDSVGVNYGVSAPGRDLALYVMTRRHLKKARNIARDPRVALVVPPPRRLLRFVPPATIQLRGRALGLAAFPEAAVPVAASWASVGQRTPCHAAWPLRGDSFAFSWLSALLQAALRSMREAIVTP